MTRLDAHERFNTIAGALASSPEPAAIRFGFAQLMPDDSASELIARADSRLIDCRRHRRVAASRPLTIRCRVDAAGAGCRCATTLQPHGRRRCLARAAVRGRPRGRGRDPRSRDVGSRCGRRRLGRHPAGGSLLARAGEAGLLARSMAGGRDRRRRPDRPRAGRRAARGLSRADRQRPRPVTTAGARRQLERAVGDAEAVARAAPASGPRSAAGSVAAV